MSGRQLTADDVAFRFIEIGNAAEAADTFFVNSEATKTALRLSTSLLQLWQVSESDAAVDEVIHQLVDLGWARGHRGSKVWLLLARKIEVAKAAIEGYRKQQDGTATRAALIDDEAGDR